MLRKTRFCYQKKNISRRSRFVYFRIVTSASMLLGLILIYNKYLIVKHLLASIRVPPSLILLSLRENNRHVIVDVVMIQFWDLLYWEV